MIKPSRLAFVFLIAIVLVGVSDSLRADDWAGWLGTSRDGVYRESGVVDSIPENGLPIKWRTAISGGYAGPAVADGKVYVFDYKLRSGTAINDPGQRPQLSGEERLLCLDAESGSIVWEYSYDCPYEISYPSGPRATPTVDGERVYILGAQGDLTCLATKDGSVIWNRNFPADFGAEVPVWGFAAHPLVDGDLLFTMVGGDGQGVVAFDKTSGQVRWKALDVNAGYCAPQIITAGGKQQLIVF
ncbi:MAG: PQQ-binding-like beta-propeller repeat protein, partial [Planctomycetales bacterium]|nr:PQQ-binding-like beta-propeller repeat protein [Planctomycetales bacterium]